MSHRQPTLDEWQRERASRELLTVQARARISPARKAFRKLGQLLRVQIEIKRR
jgi:hypothetical protein